MGKPAPPRKNRRSTDDHELIIIGRIADLLALLRPESRHRVWKYLTERLDELPVIAEISDEPSTPLPMFQDTDA